MEAFPVKNASIYGQPRFRGEEKQKTKQKSEV
jgi:hypothetical protein